MAYMSSVLSLDVFASIGDDKTVDSGSSSSIASSQGPQTQHRSPRFVSTTSNQRAMMLKATIGWFYHSDSQRTTAWGESWFRPIVMRAHDILVDLQGYVSTFNEPLLFRITIDPFLDSGLLFLEGLSGTSPPQSLKILSFLSFLVWRTWESKIQVYLLRLLTRMGLKTN